MATDNGTSQLAEGTVRVEDITEEWCRENIASIVADIEAKAVAAEEAGEGEGELNDDDKDYEDDKAMAAADIAALEAIPGATSDFVVLALKSKLTISQATAIAADRAKLSERANLAQQAAGDDRALQLQAQSGGVVHGGGTATLGADANHDEVWRNNEAVRKQFGNSHRAFLGMVNNRKKRGLQVYNGDGLVISD